MDNRTLGDDIEANFHGRAGIPTGGFANQVGLDHYNSTNSPSVTGTKKSGHFILPAQKKSFEEIIGEWLVVLASGGAAYFALVKVGLAWYWAVGAAIIAWQSAKFLLRGPLKFILPLLKWSVYVALAAGAVWIYKAYIS